MATLTTNWQNIAYYRFEPGTGFKCDYYLDAKYSTQDIANNTTTVQTRLRSVVVAGSGSAYGYEFTCTYCPTVSGSNQKWFATETITSGESTITHEDDGTKSVTLYATMKMTAVGLNASMSGTATMPRIQRYAIATSGTNFTDEEDPVLTFSNVGLYGLRAKITVGNTEVYSADLQDQTVTSYTYSLSTAQRRQLRQLCTGQNMTVTLAICSVDTNNTILYTSTADVVMTIVNARPTFTYTFQEREQKVIDLLGSSDATTLISNVSRPLITTTFQTYKYATARLYNIKEGVPGHIIQSYTTPNPTSPASLGAYTTGINDSGIYRIRLVDSRGFETVAVDNQRTLLSYNEVKINNYSFKRQSPISSNVIFNGDFNYWGNVGSYTNTPVVKYKLDNGSWVAIPSTNYTIDSTNHKLTITDYEITNILPYTTQGQFSISIEDELTSKEDTSDYGKVLKGVPTFDAGEHDLKINGTLYVADINGNNAVNVLEELEKAKFKYIQAYQSTRYTPSITAWQLVPFWISDADTNDSSMFVFSDLQDRITIGAGVNQIEVSAEVSWWQASAIGEFDVQITKNGQSLGNEFIVYGTTSTDINNRAITPTIVDVQQGDYIQVGFSTGVSSIEVLNNKIYIRKVS